MAFLNETGLQELRARLEAVYARKANITAGNYGDSANQTPDYGDTFKVPYITVNAQGIITGISDHTVKIPENAAPSVTPPTITFTNEQTSGSGWNPCRLKIVITRTAASGTTYYSYNAQDSYANGTGRPFAGSFTGASATVYTQYTYGYSSGSSSRITATVIAATKVGNDQSLITIAGGISNAGSCNCNCGCSCDCGST